MKPLHWIGSSLRDLRDCSIAVRSEVGFSLRMAQEGSRAVNALPMVGFGNAKVLELVINDGGEAYRAIYTVKFSHAVYALHVFQKKSTKGIATPRPDINLIRDRLKAAEQHYRTVYETPRKELANENGA